MKIAFIVGGLPFGGVENSLLDLAKSLRGDSEIDLRVINISGIGEKMQEFADEGIHVYTCGESKKVLKVQNVSTILKLRKLLKEIDPDIIHTTHFSADHFGRLAAIGLGKKVITHIRNVKMEKKAHRRFSNRFLCRFTDMYLSVSKDVLGMVDRVHNVCGKPNLLLYDFFDLSKADSFSSYSKSDFGLEGKTVIVSCGRIVPQKNVDKIISALPAVCEKFENIHYIIIGGGRFTDEYKALAKRLDVSDKVTFLGYRKDVYSILKMSDIYCMPSEYEGFGIAHLEAMSVGLPSVVSKNVQTLELDGGCTHVCDTTPESVAEKILNILENPEEAHAMAQRGVEVSRLYTLDCYKEKIIRIYKDLLGV